MSISFESCPIEITRATVRVARTSQCPVLAAMRTEQIDNPSSALAEVRKLTIRQVSESNCRFNDRSVEAMIAWSWQGAAFGDRFRIANLGGACIFSIGRFRKTLGTSAPGQLRSFDEVFPNDRFKRITDPQVVPCNSPWYPLERITCNYELSMTFAKQRRSLRLRPFVSTNYLYPLFVHRHHDTPHGLGYVD